MKLHLPKLLALALMSAMCAGVVYANAPQRHTPEAIITDSLDGIGSSGIVAKDGAGNLNITENTSLSCSLFIREGKVLVGNGETEITLSNAPGSPYSTYGSLIVAGKDAEVVFDKAIYDNGSAAFIRIGGYDGNGSLQLINGSKRVSGDCELFTIGVNDMPATQVSASPQCTTNGGSGSDAGAAYVGTYVEAANGSGASFGRGDVVVSGGSEIELSHASFWMGEGTLTVEGGSMATAGDYRGFRTLMGLGENSTSEIIVKGKSTLEISAKEEFSTNCSSNSVSNITIDDSTLTVKEIGSYNYAYLGTSDVGGAENTSASIVVKNGGVANIECTQTSFLDSASASLGAELLIDVQDSASALNVRGRSLSIYEGTVLSNSGTVNLDTDNTVYMYGGTIHNKEAGKITVDGDIQTYSIQDAATGRTPETIIVNDGTLEAGDFTLSGGEITNNGVIDAYVTVSGVSTLTNNGEIQGTTWLNGSSARLIATDGSSMGKVFVSKGTMVIAGSVAMKNSFNDYNSSNVQLVFTEDGILDMGGNSLTLGNVEVLLQLDGHVDQMTAVDDKEFFTNYSTSDFSENMDVVVVGSDGSYTIRKIGNLNYGAFLGGSRNQRAFYNALQEMVADGNAPQELEALARTQDAGALEAGIDALSGHEYATAMSSQIEGNLGHLRRLKDAMGKGNMLGMETDAKSGAIARVDRWRAGVSVFHEETSIDSDASGDGYDRSETGAMLNAEYCVKDDLTLGGAVSNGRTNLRTDGAARRHEDNTRFDVYALYGKKRWSFATSLGLGMHEHELLGGDVDGYSINFLQDAAYTVLSCDDCNVQVFGTVESSWNEIDGFADGLIAGASQDAWATDVTVGLRYNRALRALGNAPAGVFTAQTGVTASIGDIKSGVDMSIGGYGYRQESATRNRWGWNLGAGVDVPVRNDVSVYGAVDAVIRGDSCSVDGQVGVKVSF